MRNFFQNSSNITGLKKKRGMAWNRIENMNPEIGPDALLD
jgi:hypothetical protein